MAVLEKRINYSRDNIDLYVNKVTHLLETTRLNVNEIFEMLGTTNTPLIREAFKNRHGVTFSLYRESLRTPAMPLALLQEKQRVRYTDRRLTRTQDQIQRDAMRMAHALATTNLSIEQIHEELDISDGDPGRHTFKRLYGLNYKEYRSAVSLGKIPPERNPIEENNMNTESNINKVAEVADLLVNTDLPVKAILAKFQIRDEPKFYTDFRFHYGCTPTEYRNHDGDLNSIAASSKSTIANQDFDFTVTVRQIHRHAPPIPGEHDLSSTMMVPFLVNDLYEYRAQVITTAGQCPFSDPYDLLKSEYRDKFNDLVVKTVMPFYHGQLNIAYMQTLPQSVYSGGFPPMPSKRPGAWANQGTAQPGFEHGR